MRRNPDVEAELYAQTEAEQMHVAEFVDFYTKHGALWHGPWCHLRGRMVELDAEGFHADCYACPCKETCSGPHDGSMIA